MAHDTRYWHEPYTFKPERWTDPDCKDNKAASQPFSMGPRACIGKKWVPKNSCWSLRFLAS